MSSITHHQANGQKHIKNPFRASRLVPRASEEASRYAMDKCKLDI